ncbi:MAG: esterase family protein [Prolixibacteraceae bacterium]|nr:esterase family protein [Prolixibacteraceae bacterium]
MNREYHRWYSPNLQRDMELLVYGHAGTRVLLFPTRTARFYDYENWNIIESIKHYIEDGCLQIYSLDSIDQESFYCFWAHPQGRIQRHIQYENYILNEVIPLTSIKNPNPFLMSVGCSMGAYHAMNIALKHPHLFGKLVALSGRYDLTLKLGMFDDLFSGYYSNTIYYNVPSHYIPNLPEGDQLQQIRKMKVTIVCGKEDVFLANNREFSETLKSKSIQHDFYEWDGMAHKAKYWRQMLPMYL